MNEDSSEFITHRILTDRQKSQRLAGGAANMMMFKLLQYRCMHSFINSFIHCFSLYLANRHGLWLWHKVTAILSIHSNTLDLDYCLDFMTWCAFSMTMVIIYGQVKTDCTTKCLVHHRLWVKHLLITQVQKNILDFLPESHDLFVKQSF